MVKKCYSLILLETFKIQPIKKKRNRRIEILYLNKGQMNSFMYMYSFNNDIINYARVQHKN